MKIRTMKLLEAHKSADDGRGAMCSIAWSARGDHLVTASSADNSICIHDVSSPSNKPKCLRNHREGVTALALSPNSTCLASGSMDHSVKLYKFPGGEFESNITRFTLPIRAVAFNKSGAILAAGGDDEDIKLVNTIDGTIARVLKGHKGPVTSLAFDPKGEYLASLDSEGTIIYWELFSGSTLHVLKAVAPDNGVDVLLLNILAWSPDAEMLAAPGRKNDVVLYDRDTAEKLFSLRGDHSQPVCFLSWSPNGKYMATSGTDKQILIWDVQKKQDIERQKFSECISCMAWKPHGNAIAIIDVMGKYGVWDSAVPLTMKSPTEDIPGLQSKNSNGVLLFDEEGEPSASGNFSDLNEDSYGEFESSGRKRLRKRAKYDEEWEEDIGDELENVPKVEHRKKASNGHKDNTNGKSGSRNVMVAAGIKMQEAFQPGSTPAQPGKRHFMCYNMLGSITTMEHDGYSHIEIDFHDTSTGPRVPAMTDHYGFTMASLNEVGSVFANPCKGEKSMSTLMYRPFSSWANNSEWSMRFEGEEVRAVALGSAWVAAVTSLNFLRIFTQGGLQRHILSLDGPVVTATGYKDELAVITHISPPLPSDEQMLEFRVFNVLHGAQTFRGKVPLTPGSCLTWFGFSEEGQLSSYDSKGVLRIFSNQYGGSWLPLFSSSKLQKQENYWIVGLNSSKLFCVVCKSPETFPQSAPKPVLTLLDLSFPLASSDLGADSLENEFIMLNMHLSQIQRSMEERAASGLDTASLDDEAFNLEASLDRCILRLIASCCNGDKLVRATELVKLLSLEKSVRGAIKLVTALKLPNLAEHFNTILEEKLLKENRGDAMLPSSSKSNIPVKSEKLTSPPKTKERSESTKPPSSIQTTANAFMTRKRDPEGSMKVEVDQTCPKTSAATKLSNNGAAETTKIGKVDQVNFRRPSNPFAKASSTDESPSLFDSLKKMKKSDVNKG
ncbi:protein ENHANCER OF LHP1 1 isoform X2 [Andrographis paniculata]|uniref:protein ENHANCER OF LHP1 1 isoform X2 n=1 Tax=Andrographis paniculata TaxID=175694 RepID=UPI0021E9AAC9|nr:protein ENHANCER OF LHP1 1 isoform X2 [Andrographis paniculata]